MKYAGVWRAGAGGLYLWTDADWTSFEQKWKELSAQNLRLIDFETWMDNGQRRFAGIWEEGSDPHYLWVGLDWDTFVARWQELGSQNQRLTVLRTYVDNGQVRYAGVWRQGSDGYYLWAGADWDSFQARWADWSAQGFRLVSFDTCDLNGQRLFSGAWREGSDAHYLWVGVPWDAFASKWQELAQQSLRLTQLRAYDEGGQTLFAGVWRAGDDPYYIWAGVNGENLVGKWHQLNDQGLRLINMSVWGTSDTACTSRVVSPTAYDYLITADATVYHRPVVVDGNQAYVRCSAVEVPDAPFTLPFNNPAVTLWQGWIYSSGGYHHAIDFGIDGSSTFEVHPAAAGTVVFVGWDNWSGNTAVVSHDIGGTDTYRTIYMHLRNGAANDCAVAWSNTVPTLSGQDLTDYVAHLNDSGCASDPGQRNLDAASWGTDAQTLDPQLMGRFVQTSDVLGWAGDTGPGGKRGAGTGAPNVHLHIFFARKDPTDGQWYFFDPYGLYNQRSCYPATFADAIQQQAAGYPIAWSGGTPQYP